MYLSHYPVTLLLGLKLYKNPKLFSGSWNFGPNSSEFDDVQNVASKIIKNMKKGTIEISANPDNQHEANLLKLNCDKASKILNWKPRWSVDKTIEETAKWYSHFLEGKDVSKVSLDQIKSYFDGELN